MDIITIIASIAVFFIVVAGFLLGKPPTKNIGS